MSNHEPPSEDIVYLQNALPALQGEIRQLGNILSRAPRVINYQTIALNPSTPTQPQVVQLAGFDASRASITMWASGAGVYIGNRENLEIAGSTNGSTPGVQLPLATAPLQLQNTGHVFAVNQTGAVLYVSVVTESYSTQ